MAGCASIAICKNFMNSKYVKHLKALLAARTPGDWSKPHFTYTQEEWDAVPRLPLTNRSKKRCDCGYILCDSCMGAVAEVFFAKGKNKSDEPPLAEAVANAELLHLAAVNAENVVRLDAQVKVLREALSGICQHNGRGVIRLNQAIENGRAALRQTAPLTLRSLFAAAKRCKPPVKK